MSKAYTSNLTCDPFEWIEPLLPKAKPGGRPRTVCLWAVLNAIFYSLILFGWNAASFSTNSIASRKLATSPNTL